MRRLAVVVAVAIAASLIAGSASVVLLAGDPGRAVAGSGAATAARGVTPGPAGGPWPAATAPRLLEAARHLLDRRALAIRRGDRAAFLGLIDPAAAGFRRAQAALFDNLARVPFAQWEYRPVAAEAVRGERFIARSTVAYRIRGVDAAPLRRTVYLGFVRSGGRWWIGSDGAPAGRADDPEPWSDGPVAVVRAGPALVIGPAADRDELVDLARRAKRAVGVVTRTWGAGWGRRAAVLVPASAERAAQLAGRDMTGLAAVAAPPGARIVISPAGLRALSPPGRDVVLAHELTHLATRRATGPATPAWLVEGFADHVGYRSVHLPVGVAAAELAAEVRAGRSPWRLPGTADFAPGAARPAQAYQEAWLACRMIVERYGEPALVRVYRVAGARGERAALGEVLRTDPRRFTADWRRYVRAVLR